MTKIAVSVFQLEQLEAGHFLSLNVISELTAKYFREKGENLLEIITLSLLKYYILYLVIF